MPFSTLLALAHEFKGVPYLEAARELGAHVVLLTNSAHLHEPWPQVDEIFDMPDIHRQPDLLNAVSYLARERSFGRVVALDDYDVEPAAVLREHLQLDGMDASTARRFRDKLAMRVAARREGLAMPEFVGMFERAAIAAFMERVPPPWVLKPRTMAGSEGIRKLYDPDELWRELEVLGDHQSHFLLEQFISGDVYHVDALLWQGEVATSLVSKYGTPPLTALQQRGIFTTRTLPQGSEEATTLRALAAKLVTALGRRSGPTHSEFIRAEDGSFHFLETSARVGGGNIDKLIAAASDLVMWREAARIDLAEALGERYRPPPLRAGYARLIACPTSHTTADTSAYTEPEIVHRLRLQEFVSLIVASDSFERVEALLADYADRFARDFLA